MLRFTRTEQLIYDTLADGQSHSKEELKTLLSDDLSASTLKTHLTNMRKKMNPIGHDIISESWRDGTRYRWVRIVGVS